MDMDAFYFDNLLGGARVVKLFVKKVAHVSVHQLNEASSDSECMCERKDV